MAEAENHHGQGGHQGLQLGTLELVKQEPSSDLVEEGGGIIWDRCNVWINMHDLHLQMDSLGIFFSAQIKRGRNGQLCGEKRNGLRIGYEEWGRLKGHFISPWFVLLTAWSDKAVPDGKSPPMIFTKSLAGPCSLPIEWLRLPSTSL